MRVELINKEYINDIFKNHGEFACCCYNTPKKYAKNVGKKCVESGHFSGSRCEYFKFEISGVSRALTAQLNRHSVGVVINERSMRYCDFSDAGITIPPMIEKDKVAKEIYLETVENSRESYKKLQQHFLDKGLSKEKVNEDIRMLLPLGTQTSGTWGFTLEALIHFMNKRLCTRSQWEIRKLANEMKKQVLEVLPELEEHLVPHCKSLLYCPEDKCCGLAPRKEELLELIQTRIVTKQ